MDQCECKEKEQTNSTSSSENLNIFRIILCGVPGTSVKLYDYVCGYNHHEG